VTKKTEKTIQKQGGGQEKHRDGRENKGQRTSNAFFCDETRARPSEEKDARVSGGGGGKILSKGEWKEKGIEKESIRKL